MENGGKLGWKMVESWSRKWWKVGVENKRNLIQRMAEFRGWKTADL
jgi:hypothetical protein